MFGEYPNMQLTVRGNIAEKCKDLNAHLSRKWTDEESKQQYLSTFSTARWNKLSTTEKKAHRLSRMSDTVL